MENRRATAGIFVLASVLLAAFSFHLLHTARPVPSDIRQWGVLAAVHDEAAIRSLREAARSGVDPAARTLGHVLIERIDEASVREGLTWLEQAAHKGDALAQLLLGRLFFKGAPGVAADHVTARRWLMSAVQAGQPAAAHYIGLILKNGSDGQAPDPVGAVHWMTEGAQAGIADSQFLLGEMLLAGTGVTADPQQARHWFEAAAEQEQPEAHLQLLMSRSREEMGLKRDASAEAEQYFEAQHSLRHRPPAP